jgi:hypothetical protein
MTEQQQQQQQQRGGVYRKCFVRVLLGGGGGGGGGGGCGGLRRVWLQGVVVGTCCGCGGVGGGALSSSLSLSSPLSAPSLPLPSVWLLDDGTGVVRVLGSVAAGGCGCGVPCLGAFVGVLGRAGLRDGVPAVVPHKLIDLSAQPNRESLWALEAIEAHITAAAAATTTTTITTTTVKTPTTPSLLQ